MTRTSKKCLPSAGPRSRRSRRYRQPPGRWSRPATRSPPVAGRNIAKVAVASKLLTYATGRGAEYYDAPAIRKMVKEAAADDYRWSSLILGVVKSVPFQMRALESTN